MKPFKPLSPKQVVRTFASLTASNSDLISKNAELTADLEDAKNDVADAKADAAELKLERFEYKDNEDVVAFKALNQTAFMALTATERDIMIYKVLKAI